MNYKNIIFKFSFLFIVLSGLFLTNNSASAGAYICKCNTSLVPKEVDYCTVRPPLAASPCDTYCSNTGVLSCELKAGAVDPKTGKLIVPATLPKDTSPKTVAPIKTTELDVSFKPQVAIPGSEFQVGKGVAIGTDSVNGQGQPTKRSDLLSRYIAAIYNWGIGVVGVVAVLMLMAAGLLWLTSGGDGEKINQAKKIIGNTLLGSALLVGSWFILNTINPSLTSMPTIETVIVGKKTILADCAEKNNGDSCRVNEADKAATGYCFNKSCKTCAAFGDSCTNDYECKSGSNGTCGFGNTSNVKYPSLCDNHFCSGAPAKLGSACGDNNIGTCLDVVICPSGKSFVNGGTSCASSKCCASVVKTEGASCGANSAGKCMADLIAPKNYSALSGGRDCGSGLYCYQPSGKVGETCGLNHPGICRSGQLCPSGENGVSGGRDCVSGANCCEPAGAKNEECGSVVTGFNTYSGICLEPYGIVCPGLRLHLIAGRSCQTGLYCCTK